MWWGKTNVRVKGDAMAFEADRRLKNQLGTLLKLLLCQFLQETTAPYTKTRVYVVPDDAVTSREV